MTINTFYIYFAMYSLMIFYYLIKFAFPLISTLSIVEFIKLMIIHHQFTISTYLRPTVNRNQENVISLPFATVERKSPVTSKDETRRR